jgi:hypothetical protein
VRYEQAAGPLIHGSYATEWSRSIAASYLPLK